MLDFPIVMRMAIEKLAEGLLCCWWCRSGSSTVKLHLYFFALILDHDFSSIPTGLSQHLFPSPALVSPADLSSIPMGFLQKLRGFRHPCQHAAVYHNKDIVHLYWSLLIKLQCGQSFSKVCVDSTLVVSK